MIKGVLFIGTASKKENEYFTYEDYLSWPDDVRYELIDGVPKMMSAPSRFHQEISGELYLQIGNFLKGKPCKVYYPPFEIKLKAFKKKDTVL